VSKLFFWHCSTEQTKEVEMPYEQLADAVFWFHMVWVMYLLVGSWLFMVWKRFVPYYVVSVVTTVLGQLLWLGCPLVTLENTLRAMADHSYRPIDHFIVHYAKQYFGLEILPLFITMSLVVIFVLSAVMMWLYMAKASKQTEPEY